MPYAADDETDPERSVGARAFVEHAREHPGKALLTVTGVMFGILVGLNLLGVTSGGGFDEDEDFFLTDHQQMIEHCAHHVGGSAEAHQNVGQSSVASQQGQDSEGNGLYTVTLRGTDRKVLATCTVEQTPDKFMVGPDRR
jgi:hypothetical protein